MTLWLTLCALPVVFAAGCGVGHLIERRRFDRLLDTARQIRRALNHERGTG